MSESVVYDESAVEVPVSPFVAMTSGEIIRTVLCGMGVGLLTALVMFLMNKFVFGAVLCRAQSMADCSQAPTYAMIVAMVIGAIAGLVALARLRVYRPLLIVLAATNRADVLDPALLRPGRFDRHTTITLPERKDREAILKVHFKNKPTDNTVNLDKLAAKTAGSSGADLANIANEAAIIAARRNSKHITGKDLTEAFEKVAIGPERKAKVMNEREKEMTAYHEAGHAVVGHVLPDSDPVHKVTIIPRGGTGGVTWFLPPEDKSYTNVYEFKDILARAMGGRIAEKLIYGPDGITTGAGSDLRKATEIARDMIIEQGMGSKLRDQVFHEDAGGMVFDKITHERPYSDATAKEIDTEVEALIKEAGRRAELVLTANRTILEKLKDALLKAETLEEDEVLQLMNGTTLPKEAMLHS